MTEMRVLERVARNAPFGVSSSVRNASDEQRDAKRQRFRTIDWPVVKNLARYFCAKASDGRWVCALHTKSRKGDPFGPRPLLLPLRNVECDSCANQLFARRFLNRVTLVIGGRPPCISLEARVREMRGVLQRSPIKGQLDDPLVGFALPCVHRAR